MNAAQHYAEAERLLAEPHTRLTLTLAQLHATLAAAAAAAPKDVGATLAAHEQWRQVLRDA